MRFHGSSWIFMWYHEISWDVQNLIVFFCFKNYLHMFASKKQYFFCFSLMGSPGQSFCFSIFWAIRPRVFQPNSTGLSSPKPWETLRTLPAQCEDWNPLERIGVFQPSKNMTWFSNTLGFSHKNICKELIWHFFQFWFWQMPRQYTLQNNILRELSWHGFLLWFMNLPRQCQYFANKTWKQLICFLMYTIFTVGVNSPKHWQHHPKQNLQSIVLCIFLLNKNAEKIDFTSLKGTNAHQNANPWGPIQWPKQNCAGNLFLTMTHLNPYFWKTMQASTPERKAMLWTNTFFTKAAQTKTK